LHIAARVLLIFTLPVTLAAQEHPSNRTPRPVGEPWNWTVSERLAKRFEVEDMRRRAAEYHREIAAGNAGMQAQSTSSSDVFVIDGKKDPELFLPYELLTALLNGLSSDARARDSAQRSYRKSIEDFGWKPSELWSRLEAILDGYPDLVDRESALQTALRSPQTPSVHDRLTTEQKTLRQGICARRAALLKSARAIFGETEFDRFLYTVIAPTLTAFSKVPASEDEAKKLQHAEEGCR